MKEVYLDWAAAAPVSNAAWKAFEDAMREEGNPGSPHGAGARARGILEEARKVIARIAGVKTDGVIFTSGATESNALAIQGHIKALRAQGRKPQDIHILYLPTAHASVFETMQVLAKEGVQIEQLVLLDGAVDLVELKKQIRSETALVSMDVICGETGTRFDTRDVRRVLDVAREEREQANRQERILLHVDASQAPFVESIEHTHLGADLITLDAQKIGGVRGIGALIRANVFISLAPLIYGGGQEQGFRPGTENPALAAAFALALQEAIDARGKDGEGFFARAAGAREELVSTLLNAIPDIVVNVGKESAPNILNLSFPNRDTDYAVMLLSNAGYYVSTKSACETDADGSRVVLALTGDADRARSTLRISWGLETHESELHAFAQELIRTVCFLDEHTLSG
jgi:cysteine desulfurase